MVCSGWLKHTEEGIGRPEGNSFEIIESEEQRNKKNEKVNRAQGPYSIPLIRAVYSLWENWKEKWERNGQWDYFKKRQLKTP